MGDLHLSTEGFVRVMEIRRPPLNFFDLDLIQEIAAAVEETDTDPGVRSLLLCAEGKAFCAGANFTATPGRVDTPDSRRKNTQHLYSEAVRIFRGTKPIVAAVQGAAIGGGLGLAMAADFRVTCPEARFAANFTRLGFHPGFGLTVTLPEVVGRKKAEFIFYTSRRIGGEEAYRIGLADELVPQDQVRSAALALATEIAECSPLGTVSTRRTMRGDLADRIAAATEHELSEQSWLRETEDFREGVRATAERRVPAFQGK